MKTLLILAILLAFPFLIPYLLIACGIYAVTFAMVYIFLKIINAIEFR